MYSECKHFIYYPDYSIPTLSDYEPMLCLFDCLILPWGRFWGKGFATAQVHTKCKIQNTKDHFEMEGSIKNSTEAMIIIKLMKPTVF